MDDNFQEFLAECKEQLVNTKAKGLVKLITKRYSEADQHYLQSEDFANLLNNIRQSIVTDSKRFFVHLKDFLQALKDKKGGSGNSCSGDEHQPPKKRARVLDSDDCSGAESGETSRACAALFEDSELGSSLSESETDNGRKDRIVNIIQSLCTDQDHRKTDLANDSEKNHIASDQSCNSSDSSLPAFNCYSSVREIHDEAIEECIKVDIQDANEIEEEEECNEITYNDEGIQDANEEEEEDEILMATKLYPEDTGDEFEKSEYEKVDSEDNENQDNLESSQDIYENGIEDVRETELAQQEKALVNVEQSKQEMDKDSSDESSNSEASENKNNKTPKNRGTTRRETDTDCEERKELAQRKVVRDSSSEGHETFQTAVKKRKREDHTSSNEDSTEDSTDSDDDRRIRQKCRKKYVVSVGKSTNKSTKSHSPSRSGHSSGMEKHSRFSDSKFKYSPQKKISRKKSPGRMSPKNKKDIPLVIITDSESSSECDLTKETFIKKLDEKYGKNLLLPSEQVSLKKEMKKSADKRDNVKKLFKEKLKDSELDDSTDDAYSRKTKRKYDSESETEIGKKKINLLSNSEKKRPDKETADHSVKVKHDRDFPKVSSSLGTEGEGTDLETGQAPGSRDDDTIKAGPSSDRGDSKAKPETSGAEKKKGSSRQIKRLEDLLLQISKKIEEVRRRELSLDDLESDVSDYLLEDKLQRKLMKVWEKLCELNKAATITGRHTEKYFRYQGTRYPDINKKIEKYINRKKVFPDYHDIRKIVVAVNKSKGLHLRPRDICDLAREAFTEVGNKLQRRRQKDVAATYKTDEILDVDDDIPFSDPELRRKLDANKKMGKTKMNEICEKYVHLQMTEGDKLDDDDEDDDEEQEDDEETGKANMEELEIDAAITNSMVDNSDTESPCLEIDIAIDLEEPSDTEGLQEFKGAQTVADEEMEEESFAAKLDLKLVKQKKEDAEKEQEINKEDVEAHAKSTSKGNNTHPDTITIDLEENEMDVKDTKKKDSSSLKDSGNVPQRQPAVEEDDDVIIIDDTSSVVQKMDANLSGSKPVAKDVGITKKPTETTQRKGTNSVKGIESNIFKTMSKLKPDEKISKPAATIAVNSCKSFTGKSHTVFEESGFEIVCLDDISSSKPVVKETGITKMQKETVSIKGTDSLKGNDFNNFKMKPDERISKPAETIAVKHSKSTTGTSFTGKSDTVFEKSDIEVVCLDDIGASKPVVQETGITGKSRTVFEESGCEVVCLDDISSSKPVDKETHITNKQKETVPRKGTDSLKGNVSNDFRITSKMKPDERISKSAETNTVESFESINGKLDTAVDESIEMVCLDQLSESSGSEESDILIPLVTRKDPLADDVSVESEPEDFDVDENSEILSDTADEVNEIISATSDTSEVSTVTKEVSYNKLSDAQTCNSINLKEDDLESSSEFHENSITKNKHSELVNSSTQVTEKTTELKKCKALDTNSDSRTREEGELETEYEEPYSEDENMEKVLENQLDVNTCVSSISDIFQDETPVDSLASTDSLKETEIDDKENVEEKCKVSAATNNPTDTNIDNNVKHSGHSSPLHNTIDDNLENTEVEIDSNEDPLVETDSSESSDFDLKITNTSKVVSSQISRVTEKLKHPAVKDNLIKLEERATHLMVYPIVKHKPKTEPLELEEDEHADLIETYIEPNSTVISESHLEDVIVLSDSD